MEIVEEWKTFILGDVVSIGKEKYNPKKEKLVLPNIELEHLESKTGRLLGHFKSNEQKSVKNYFKPNDVLYGKLRPYLRKFYLPKFKGVCSSEIWVLRGNQDKLRNNYLYYLVQSNKFNGIANKSSGTKMPRADWSYMSQVAFKIPSLVEQDKIASILSTWDEGIELNEKLIEQKKEQKKGLMQKLLTGKVRLPGYNAKWRVVKIKDLSEVVTGTTPSTKVKEYYENGHYPWITPTDISDLKYISKGERNLTGKGLRKGRFVPAGSLLVTCIASIGKNAILTKDGSCNQQINAILPTNSHSNEFLYYKIEKDIKRLETLAGKTATAIINKNTFENFEIAIPEYKEQIAISKILSQIDQSIELATKKIDQLKEQKKGLMQLLLTGKARVKV